MGPRATDLCPLGRQLRPVPGGSDSFGYSGQRRGGIVQGAVTKPKEFLARHSKLSMWLYLSTCQFFGPGDSQKPNLPFEKLHDS